ncbi:DNA endonuclease SmrA [Larsenimonas rhizosphaerae]|uniref:DNA endonuclease SmrA n=1 Tax=Larsenimonas rhizosphaerae TaxID=2944682 RepID=A0AA42CTL5_9GAMM|nr:DNA endonuclease SmrA [Larsenimonas rhizosphaerae]MCM2130650.1 DNA endonuclease SmrA [Larsenimonas rhizosphaerae]MCX2523354.1 DNA endonuclease SmrA [Larsenimonas rhizosphaerae]
MDDNDDQVLFSKEMAGVIPLKPRDRVVPIKPPGPPTEAQLARRESAQRAEQTSNFLSDEFVELLPANDPVEYRRDGIQTGVIDKLRQGRYHVDARINITRRSLEECRREVFAFIREAFDHELRTLLIIHGRGRDDASHANIVRSYVVKWLQQFEEVQAFASAQTHQGGVGATTVALRKSPRASHRNRELHQRRRAP